MTLSSYRPGDLVLIAFPFTDGVGEKRRPALILLDTGDPDVIVSRVTSQSYSTPFDIALENWEGANLLRPSTVRLHKLATLDKTLVSRQLGQLSADDWGRVVESLQRLWAFS
ncbi:type II toxin-antitoxin system PemK/MazF family toxin [Nodosilinea nodulosa]|uniref:type II toxin-antitoxin system PemK/MazF family toxin n=1 Tax=Nodosilinea nodulosa TaxID=416001 RepID=UPI0008FAFFCD|nr:type II toxin-antitoxin system PemK/MazF family toxin [Nodosilinea nodulosa]